MEQGHRAVVTTVIPTYRRPGLLRRAIRSALNQTRGDLIVSVVDNASGDETPAVVRDLMKADPRVRYFCQPDNVGIARNFDSGMRQVDTPYFSFLSDDDLLLPGFYEEAIDALEREPSAAFFAARSIISRPDGTPVGLSMRAWKPGKYDPPAGLLAILSAGLPYWTSVVFRRELLSDVGFLDTDSDALADLDYLIRVASRHSLVASDSPRAVFFLNPDSTGRHMKLKHFSREGLRIIGKIKSSVHLSDEYRSEALRLYEKRFALHLFAHARSAAMRGDTGEASEAAQLLANHFCAHTGAAQIKLLMGLDRLGLGSLLRLAADTTRWLRHPTAFFFFGRKTNNSHRQLMTGALQGIAPSVLQNGKISQGMDQPTAS